MDGKETMRQRLTTVAILFGLVGLPVGVTTLAEQFDEYSRLPVIAAFASPAVLALALDQHRSHQKA